jgi:purine-binding chemotaxis protein CheW
MEGMVLPVGDAWHALALGVVREVVPAVPISTVPDAPVWLRGLANLRGAIVPVVDSSRGVGGPATTGVTHLVLADTAGGVAALVASGTPSPASLGEPAGAGDRPGAVGRFTVGDRVATLLDLDVLCDLAEAQP